MVVRIRHHEVDMLVSWRLETKVECLLRWVPLFHEQIELEPWLEVFEVDVGPLLYHRLLMLSLLFRSHVDHPLIDELLLRLMLHMHV